MNDYQHTVLLVDDEENILNALKRLLRMEGYRLLSASSGPEGLKALGENNVHVVVCDQRMPEMSGTEFLAKVKEKFPDLIRIVLTGYTDVDSIAESINKGHVYKFLLKPWNDENIKLEIRQALDQYDLIQANKRLQRNLEDQNEELKTMNENLERMVEERTKVLEIQNQALELSRAILEELPLPVIGVSEEGIIVLMNREAQRITDNGKGVGSSVSDYFSDDLEEKLSEISLADCPQTLEGVQFSGLNCAINCIPLSGRFKGKGVILTLNV